MQFSEFLNSRREACRALVAELGKTYAYVGILGSDVKSTAIRVNRTVSDIGEGGAAECGFVVKMHNGRAFFEYSIDDVTGDINIKFTPKIYDFAGEKLLYSCTEISINN